jgi:hypothetical protein
MVIELEPGKGLQIRGRRLLRGGMYSQLLRLGEKLSWLQVCETILTMRPLQIPRAPTISHRPIQISVTDFAGSKVRSSNWNLQSPRISVKMRALDIPEILAAIFEEFCNDSEFDAHRDAFIENKPSSPRRGACRAHHPKPFLGSLEQVCKAWLGVILYTPNLRVTEICFPHSTWHEPNELWQSKLSRARELLEDPLESDIDLHIGVAGFGVQISGCHPANEIAHTS